MNELEEFDHRQLIAAHTFAYQKAKYELVNLGEVAEETWSQLGRVCFEVMKRQDNENEGLGK